MKYNNVIFLGLCLGLTTYSALSADSVIKYRGKSSRSPKKQCQTISNDR